MKRLVPALIWGLFLLLYTVTAGPSIVELFDDTLEFQLVLPTFGIAHPTGYPLYVLVGGLFAHLLPVGNWAWRVNLFSALCGATTVLLLFLLARRLCTRPDGTVNQWAGATAALVFGLGPVWWSQATLAEVYPLHLLLTTAIMGTAIGINTVVGTPRFQRRMALLFLLVGLGLAHHRTTVLLLPGLALYLFWSIPGLWRPRPIWLLWIGALLAPLLLYGWIPLRYAAGARDLNGSYVNDWTGFWDHVLARSYAGFFSDNALAVDRSPGDWLQLFSHELGLVAVLLALIGLVRLVDRERRPVKAWVFVLVLLLSNLLFALNYRVGDVEVFLLPVFLCVALFVGAGVSVTPFVLSNRQAVRVTEPLLTLLAAGALLGQGSIVDRSNEWRAHNYAVAMATVDYPPDSAVVGLEGEMTALKYMQASEGLGANAQAIVANEPAVRAQVVADLTAAGRPVYLTREIAGIGPLYSFTGSGPLVRVWPRGEAETPAPPYSLAPDPMDGLLLEGYDLYVLHQAGDPALQLTLFWRPMAQPADELKVSLRLKAADGRPLLSPAGTPVTVDAFPLRQVALTPDWVAGERLSDVYTLDVAADELAEAASLEIVVYRAADVAELGAIQLDVTPFVHAQD